MDQQANVIELSSWADAREAFRQRDLRQGLYDEGRDLMADVIVNLHAQPHTARRRLENRLFRRDTFFHFERVVIPQTIDTMLEPHLRDGRVDLNPLARRVMMSLATDIAGIDRTEGTEDEFELLYQQMGRLSRASTVLHATGDKQAIIDDGNAALREFEERFFAPSRARRVALLEGFDAHRIDEDDLPRDVLVTLLRNQDRLELPADVVLREVAYYPWVGSHSTSNAFVHAAHHVFEWIAHHPEDADRLRDDPFLLQRFVHESLRLHPASPVARRFAMDDVVLPGGAVIPKDSLVIVDLVAANRDAAVFGPTAQEFDPFREIPDDVTAWGLTFGSGFHACLGQELAGGLPAGDGVDADQHLFGAITVMARTMLVHGARPDPERPAQRDANTVRPNWGSYPVVFTAVRQPA